MFFQISQEMDNTLKDLLSSFITIKRWVSEFKKGYPGTNYAPGTERPMEVTVLDIIEKIHPSNDRSRQIKIVCDGGD